jgi:hypothetical protein
MALITDYERKALSYVERRKTPPSVAEVALHLMTSRQSAARVLTNLARKRHLVSFMEKIPGRKPERRYIAVDSPLLQKLGLEVPPESKPKIKPKKPTFFNDPFNLTGARHG